MKEDAHQIAKEAASQRANLIPLPLGVVKEVMDICANSPVPNGWIKTNDYWDPTRCGNPSRITYNVWTIERFDNQPVGSVMNVCAGAPTPNGWVIVNTSWDPTRCGHPAMITPNIKQIRRLS